jgi:arylformamidase
MTAPLPPGWPTLSQQDRDAAYNNATATSDRDVIVAARDVAAAAWRKRFPEKLDIPYGSAERQKWDLFPGNDPFAPCLVHIHGGYWQYNGRDNFSHIAEGARALGWHAALPGYSLAPHATLAQIVAEIFAALDWLGANGRQHGIAGPVILTGWSAGGHLVAAALDHPLVTAGVAVSGIYELAPIRDTYVNDLLKLTETEIDTLSPIRHPPSGKRLAIAYGTAELPEMRRQSRDFHTWRAEHHRPGPLVPVASADHFRTLDSLQSPNGEVLQVARGLLG